MAQQFTQKYAIIQLFEDMVVGTQFSASNWPLHSTIADTFAIEWDVPTLIEKLTELLDSRAEVVSTAGDDRFFGDNGQVQVVLLEKTEGLQQLHNDVIAMLKQGGWKPNDPQFANEGFLPHSTVQSHGRLNKGEEVAFKELAIIDFFPEGDPYERKLLAKVKVGQ